MKLQVPRFQRFVEAASEWAEEEGYTVAYTYSGRCMYGKQCFGIIVPDAMKLYNLYFHLGWAANADGSFDLPCAPKQDNFARDTIVYWEDIRYAPEQTDVQCDDHVR